MVWMNISNFTRKELGLEMQYIYDSIYMSDTLENTTVKTMKTDYWLTGVGGGVRG